MLVSKLLKQKGIQNEIVEGNEVLAVVLAKMDKFENLLAKRERKAAKKVGTKALDQA